MNQVFQCSFIVLNVSRSCLSIIGCKPSFAVVARSLSLVRAQCTTVGASDAAVGVCPAAVGTAASEGTHWLAR